MKNTMQLAKELDVSPQRIRALASQGRILPKPKRFGTNWSFADNSRIIESGNPRSGKIKMVSKGSRK
jgi:hypothetical protein